MGPRTSLNVMEREKSLALTTLKLHFPSSSPQPRHNMGDGILGPTECDMQIKYLKSNICTTTITYIIYPLQRFCFSGACHDVTTITYQPICPYLPPLNQK